MQNDGIVMEACRLQLFCDGCQSVKVQLCLALEFISTMACADGNGKGIHTRAFYEINCLIGISVGCMCRIYVNLILNACQLAQLGFTLEPFGRNDYILRGVPAQLDAADALPALEEICTQLRHGARMDAQSVRDEVLKTVACKAAIKAGWQTEPEELLRLADAVCAGEVKYCPHGRPVAVTLTRRELDKLFKRIV